MQLGSHLHMSYCNLQGAVVSIKPFSLGEPVLELGSGQLVHDPVRAKMKHVMQEGGA